MNELKHCDKCLAYYSGPHECPPWMLMLVEMKRNAEAINVPARIIKPGEVVHFNEAVKEETPERVPPENPPPPSP